MKLLPTILLAAASLTPVAANASSVVTTKCASVASATGCLFDGNISSNASPSNVNGYVYAQTKYNTYAALNPSAGAAITLNYLFDTTSKPGAFTGAGTASGTWSTPGYKIDYLAVKAGDNFVLYKLAGISSGLWNTKDIPYNKNPKALSHMVFFGTASTAVPEPASWGMMIAGVGMAGGALRRRRGRPAAVTAA